MVQTLTFKQYLDKIIEHRLKVTPITENDGATAYRAGRRVYGNDFVISKDPVAAVSELVRLIEDR